MTGRRDVLLATAGVAVSLAGCTDGDGGGGGDGGVTPTPTPGGDRPRLGVVPFADGETIPTEYTCEGADVSPAIVIERIPDGTAALALIVDDPDAPREDPFVHWLLWNVPADTTRIPKDVPNTEVVDPLGGARQGTNSAGNLGYMGPCPPKDDGAHTYRFTLHALSRELDLDGGAKRPALDGALGDTSIGWARVTGEFDR